MERGPQSVTGHSGCRFFGCEGLRAAPAGPGFSVGALSAKTHQQNPLGCKAKALESQPPQPKVSWHQGPSTESSGLGPELPKNGHFIHQVLALSVLLVTL